MIVEKNEEVSDEFPSQIGEHHVEYLDNQELIDHYRKVRKKFSLLIISSMGNDGDRLTIIVNQQWFSYSERRKINFWAPWVRFTIFNAFYEISDWSKVVFRYDCQLQKYVIESVKLGGI